MTTNTYECVEKLAVCIFCADRGVTRLSCDVYNVLTWPQRLSEEVKRTCCLIVDNMYKFVEDAAAKLEPLVKAAYEKLSNPEARNMAERLLKFWQP